MDPFTVAHSQLQELMHRLTARQLEIVELLAQGKTNREIATILSISPETVKTHVHEMLYKLEVENRTQMAVVFAVWKVPKL